MVRLIMSEFFHSPVALSIEKFNRTREKKRTTIKSQLQEHPLELRVKTKREHIKRKTVLLQSIQTYGSWSHPNMQQLLNERERDAKFNHLILFHFRQFSHSLHFTYHRIFNFDCFSCNTVDHSFLLGQIVKTPSISWF